jgi:acyl-CoA dehydrogenase
MSNSAAFLDHDLGPDIDMLRDSVRAFAAAEIAPRAAAIDRDDAFPRDLWPRMGALGLHGITVEEAYGGAGMGYLAHVVALEEVSRASGSVGLSYGAHSNLCVNQIRRHGSEEQKRRYLPKIASGELRLQAFGVTEPTTGSDTTKLKTRAVKQGNHYVINGQKVWTSRARHSDLMLLLARTTPVDEVKRRTDGLSVFLVDLRENLGQGVEIRPIEAMINHNTTEVFFDNLAVPPENLIGEEGRGFHYILDGMNAERILVAQECIGDGRWLLNKGIEYAKERIVFDRPIGQNQGVQFPLARAYAELEAADMICRRAAARFDAGQECGADANMAKLLASEAGWHAAEATMTTFGGFAFAREYDIERKWREIRLYQTAPISTNLILAYLGQHVLGMPRSY